MNAGIQLATLKRDAEMLDELCGGDEALFHDMLIGETDIDRLVTRVHELIARDAEMLVGIKERKAAIAERKARIEARHNAQKAFVGKVMRVARLTKLELPEVTYSVRDGKPKLEIADAKAVPEQYQKPSPVPDKTKINAEFADSDELPNWLSRIPANDVVTARVK